MSELHEHCKKSLDEIIEAHGLMYSIEFDDNTAKGGTLDLKIRFQVPTYAEKICSEMRSTEFTKEEAESIKQMVDGRTREPKKHLWNTSPWAKKGHAVTCLLCNTIGVVGDEGKVYPCWDGGCPGKPA